MSTHDRGRLAGMAGRLAFAFLLLAGVLGWDDSVAAEDPPAVRNWAVTAFRGWFTDNNTFRETVTFNAGVDSSFQLNGVALSRRLTSFWHDRLDVEVEGQVVKMDRGQHHWEFNGLGVVRWKAWPWHRYLNTSLAVGLGVSYATEEPPFEILHKGGSTQLLAYLLAEAEIGLPKLPAWTVVGRVHHRSTVGNLFHDTSAASNVYVLGLKFRF